MGLQSTAQKPQVNHWERGKSDTVVSLTAAKDWRYLQQPHHWRQCPEVLRFSASGYSAVQTLKKSNEEFGIRAKVKIAKK